MTGVDVDAVRYQLTGAIECSDIDLRINQIVNVLLPVVDRIATARAAAELREVAKEIDDDARVDEARRLGQAQRAVGEARSVVLERADALDPS